VGGPIFLASGSAEIFRGRGGDYFLVKYSNMMKNLKINDAKFKPDWPKNATHVKPRQ